MEAISADWLHSEFEFHKEIQGKSDEELKKAVGEGFGKMKPVPGLSSKQVGDVVAFVRSLAKP